MSIRTRALGQELPGIEAVVLEIGRPSASNHSARAGLTAREREITELVAAGRTNREVAEQLVLSTKTIEAHLRNIYGKLGVRSRVELTRAATDSGAEPDVSHPLNLR